MDRALEQAAKVSWLATAIRELLDAGQAGEDGELLELRRAVEHAVGDLLPLAESAGMQICYSPRSPCPVWFDLQRLRQGLFHLLGYGVASGTAGAVMNIELEEREMEVLLAMTISGQGERDHASAGGPPPHDLVRRLGLGIAHTIFEAGAEVSNFGMRLIA